MLSQSRSHFFRQVMERPQVAQVLGGCWAEAGCALGLRSGMGGGGAGLVIDAGGPMADDVSQVCIRGALPDCPGETNVGSARFGAGLQPSLQVWGVHLGLRPRLVWNAPSALVDWALRLDAARMAASARQRAGATTHMSFVMEFFTRPVGDNPNAWIVPINVWGAGAPVRNDGSP